MRRTQTKIIMKGYDIKTSTELLAAGKWTKFLKSLPFGLTDWEVKNYKDVMKLRVTASGLTNNGDRTYSIKFINNSDTRIIVEVRGKSAPISEKD